MLKVTLSVQFITLTVLGNSLVMVFAVIFYFAEKKDNPNVTDFLSAIWWSFSTATTVGYGDITAVTVPGKIIGIILMLVGLAIFAVYTALFSRAIIEDDVYMNSNND